jgi:hypothetical protein
MSYTGLGATTYQRVTFAKWVDMFAAQKNEARRLFGSTSVNVVGRTDIKYPNLSGNQAKKLMAYWEPQFAVVNQRVQSDDTSGVIADAWRRLGVTTTYDRIATREAWNRDYGSYKTIAALTKGFAVAWAASALPESMSVSLWQKMEPLILVGNAIMTSPTPYDMFMESVAESAKELADKAARALTPSWYTWMKWGAIAIGGLYVYQIVKGERR